MAVAACAVSVMSGAPRAASATLSPGSTRSSCTSVGWAPDRVTSSASTAVAGPVHSGAVPPRTGVPVSAPGSCSAASALTSVHGAQVPARSRTRTCTTVSVTAGSKVHVTPTSENSATSVALTDNVGTVSGTPATGSVVPSCTCASGAGSLNDPIATSSTDVSTGTASGAGSE